MENGRIPSVSSWGVTSVTSRRLFEKVRLDHVLRLVGQYGLNNKREVWRVKYNLAKIRKTAKELLTLDEKNHKRLSQGNALLRRLAKKGVLDESRMKLDYVLGLKVEDFLERRLQTQVFRLGMAKSIQHARTLIHDRHISVKNKVVNIPSYVVPSDSQDHIDFSLDSPYFCRICRYGCRICRAQ